MLFCIFLIFLNDHLKSKRRYQVWRKRKEAISSIFLEQNFPPWLPIREPRRF